MGDFAWLAELEEFTAPALTVRAQTVSPNDNGQLIWDAFMPRVDARSIRIRDGVMPNFRPASDRREWNQRGRYIPLITPRMREMVMVPIESYYRLDEEEMQYLFENFGGNVTQQQFREIITATIPSRIQVLADSIYRRLEIDVFEAWANQQVVQKDPQTGELQTATFGFDANRYQTAGTAWNAAASAYDEFLAWYREGADELGGNAGGVMIRSATVSAIQEDAPTATGIQLSMAQLQDQIQQDTGRQFRFYVNERTVHEFTDGGTEYTARKIWPAEHVAIVPTGETVGAVHAAPVVRAMQMASQVEDAEIDVRGVTIHMESMNGGRGLIIEAQANLMPVPNEQLMWVIEAGV